MVEVSVVAVVVAAAGCGDTFVVVVVVVGCGDGWTCYVLAPSNDIRMGNDLLQCTPMTN